jgi:hypothetical protein
MDELLKLVLTYGPGAVLAVLVITGILIPKAFYDREVKRGDTATEAASKNADALKEVSTAMKEFAAILSAARDEIAANRAEIEQLREDIRAIRLRGG